MRGSLSLTGVLAALALATGCGGADHAPTAAPDPATPALTTSTTDQGTPLFQATLLLDPATMQAELQPARDAALDFPVDITGYLRVAPCADCFTLAGIGQGPGNTVDLRFGIRHPFQPTQRPDLDVFDVRLIAGIPGSTFFDRLPSPKAGGAAQVSPFAVLNADGYTAHFNSLLVPAFNGNLNPYVDFFTEADPNATLSGPTIPFHRMAAGAPMDFKLLRYNPAAAGSNPVAVQLLVEAHYGQSATRPTRFMPVYRNPQFNRKEAYALRALVQGNTLKEGDPASSATLRIEAEDWQAGATTGTGVTEVDNPSDLARLVIDLPGLTDRALESSTPDSGTGREGDPYVFTFPLTNALGAAAGTYVGMAMAEDERDPFVTDFEYRVYQAFRVTVAPPDTTGCAGTWQVSPSAVQVASQPGLSYLWPKEGIALDSAGIAHVVWTDDSSGVDRAYYARQTAPGSAVFTAAHDFTGAPAGVAALYPTIAIDRNDIVHLAWEDSRDHLNGSEVYYGTRNAAAATMTAILRVQQSETLGENIFAIFPKVAVDNAGSAYLVWADNRSDPRVVPFGVANFGVYAARIENPTLPTATLVAVSDGPRAEGFPNLTVSSGRVRAVFQDNALDGSGNRQVFYADTAGGGGFGAFSAPGAVTASTIDAGQPDIAADPDGALHIVYSHGGIGNNEDVIDLTSSTDGGMTWGAAEVVSTGGTTDYNQVVPDIAADSKGNLHV
ncbi:MAG TPA: hypothetical protein VEI97_00585, partial [bacterium]|nr:hypothetical protein [bacterium]